MINYLNSINYIKNTFNFTLDKKNNQIIFLIWNSEKYSLPNVIITFYDLLERKIINEIIDFNAIYVNPWDSPIDISYSNNYLAYINCGSEIRIWDLLKKNGFNYIPFDEENMISDNEKKIIFTKLDHYMIFNSKYTLEVVSLVDFSSVKVIKADKSLFLSAFDLSTCNNYLILVYCSDNNNFYEKNSYTIELLYLNSFISLDKYIELEGSFICRDIIFDNDSNNIVLLDYFCPLSYWYIKIFEIDDKGLFRKKNIHFELDSKYTYNFLFKNNNINEIFVLGNNDENKILYKINPKTNSMKILYKFESKLRSLINKAVFTNNGDYLVICDNHDLEVFKINDLLS